MIKISIVSPTFNEHSNVEELHARITQVMSQIKFDYEILFIDNASTDGTQELLRQLAERDSRVKLIINESNFGWIRSPYHALLQTNAEATVLISSDLQDPPEMIPSLIEKWKSGAKVVLATRKSSDEKWPKRSIRKVFYKVLSAVSSTQLIPNATGAGIFDREVINELRNLREPYPYFRGLVVELGFKVETADFHQPIRKNGKTKSTFLKLYDVALLGLISQGGAAMRLVSLLGFGVAAVSLLVALGYLLAKLIYWDSFELGLTPLILGVFFFGSVQVALLGLLGEYLASIQRRLKNLPLVIESERVNF